MKYALFLIAFVLPFAIMLFLPPDIVSVSFYQFFKGV
jgi:hypothetical protein